MKESKVKPKFRSVVLWGNTEGDNIGGRGEDNDNGLIVARKTSYIGGTLIGGLR